MAPYEKDPSGKDQHEPGAKLDAGKLKVGLVLGGFSKAIAAVVKVGTDGADKYTPDGWIHVEKGVERYTDAMLRHWLQEHDEAVDASGSLHAAHLAWNALARLELMLRTPKSPKRLTPWEEGFLDSMQNRVEGG